MRSAPPSSSTTHVAPAAVPAHASTSSTASTPALRIVHDTIACFGCGGRLVIIIDSDVLHLLRTTRPYKSLSPPKISPCRSATRPPGRPQTHAHQTASAAITPDSATPQAHTHQQTRGAAVPARMRRGSQRVQRHQYPISYSNTALTRCRHSPELK
ncbi:MAG: hypothetical protein C5S48_02000 [Candidatus Methanogaster sp.]|nr:MAG: hypothetical protein C5S48_02000 [ANME-2 cluster archaeon]